jgi:hypothetical protein
MAKQCGIHPLTHDDVNEQLRVVIVTDGRDQFGCGTSSSRGDCLIQALATRVEVQ